MSPCGRQREYQRKEESNMKKRLLSMVLTVIMLVSLIPTSVFAAKKSVDDYFDGLPIAADPGTGTTAWKVSTKDGEEVLMSGNAGKNYSSSTLTLTFTEDTHLSFEYKVSSEAKYDKCTITLGSNTLVNGESGDQEWKGLELDAKRGDKLTVLYKKDSSGDKFDDCVYLRNFSAGGDLPRQQRHGGHCHAEDLRRQGHPEGQYLHLRGQDLRRLGHLRRRGCGL